MKINKLGIIAGGGDLAELAVKEALKNNIEFCLYMLAEEKSNIEIKEAPECTVWVSLGKFDQFLKKLQADKVSHVVIAGKVHKEKILGEIRFNLKTLSLLRKLKNQNDHSLFGLIAREFENKGITVLKQDDFFKDLLLKSGTYSKIKPKKDELLNIEYGMDFARKISLLDIGQSVVIAGKTLIAVEAIEGTTETIKRAGKFLRKKAGVVCKAMRKNQDTRFDVASIGPETIETMLASNCRILAVEAGRTFVFHKEEVIKKINENKMILISL